MAATEHLGSWLDLSGNDFKGSVFAPRETGLGQASEAA